MNSVVIAFSIPFFLLCMVVEIVIDRARVRNGAASVYRLPDSITSLSCGIGQQLLQALFLSALSVAVYNIAYTKVHALAWPEGITGWVLAFVLVDFCYFLYHWASHRVAFFWATHEVHHSSEEYNLTTALRQSWFTNISSWIFYLPLAFLGIPTDVFVTVLTLNIVYQFWIHTKLIGKLGILEWVLNTPSHHRVHHGINPEYIDRNYAGTFIIWDRLFKTFIEEKEEPAYGVVIPLSSFNPVWANIDGYARLWEMSKKTRRWADKIYVWFAPPEWRPADLGGPVVVPPVDKNRRLYDVPTSKGLRRYLVVHFALVAGILGVVLDRAAVIPTTQMATVAAWGIIAVGAWGGLLEHRKFGKPLETFRILTAGPVAAYLLYATPYLWAALGACVGFAMVSLWVLKGLDAQATSAHLAKT